MTALLGDFIKKPRGVKFDGQDNEEEIILFLRQHYIVNLRWLLITVLLIFSRPILDILLSYGGTSISQILPPNYFLATNFLFVLFTFGYFFSNFVNWYFNSFLVTSKRVVDIDFYGLTNRRFSEAPLRNIEDITNHISGFAQVIFHYGDVSIQTAGELREITFENVPNPDRVQDTISDLITKIKEESE